MKEVIEKLKLTKEILEVAVSELECSMRPANPSDLLGEALGLVEDVLEEILTSLVLEEEVKE